MSAELKLAESEVELVKGEIKLCDKMIDIDWSLKRQDKLISRFLDEDALRLSEAEVRFTEAELRLAKDTLARIELDIFYDGYNEAAKWLDDHYRWLDENHASIVEERAAISQEVLDKCFEMEALADFYYMKGTADMNFAIAETEVRIAELNLRLAKERMCVAKSKLILTKLQRNNIESNKPDQLIIKSIAYLEQLVERLTVALDIQKKASTWLS